jgi:hypothetical protein
VIGTRLLGRKIGHASAAARYCSRCARRRHAVEWVHRVSDQHKLIVVVVVADDRGGGPNGA